MKTQTFIAIKILLIMIILTGIIYPLFITGVAQLIFPEKASGSLIIKDGKIMGSGLIGQKFDSSIYFWSRPSATDYNTIPSGASNSGPTSTKLKKQVEERRILFATKNLVRDLTAIPNEMIFASGSGLDPHISPEAALLQLERVVAARNFDEIKKQQLRQIINNRIEGPQYFLFGERRINIFELNLALDNMR